MLFAQADHAARFLAQAQRVYEAHECPCVFDKLREHQKKVFIAIKGEWPHPPLRADRSSRTEVVVPPEVLTKIDAFLLSFDTDGFEEFPIADSRGVNTVRSSNTFEGGFSNENPPATLYDLVDTFKWHTLRLASLCLY